MAVKRIWSQEDIADIKRLYEYEWVMKEIAKKYGTKAGTIGEILRAEHCEIKRSRSKNRLLNEGYFSEIDSSNKAYLLGLLFTDGSIIRDKEMKRADGISIELTESDKDILDKLKEEISCDSALVYNKRKNRPVGTFSIRFRSCRMSRDLEKYGIVPNKTQNTYHIPDCIQEQFMPDFIRGLIDGDGSIYYSKGCWHINFCAHYKSIALDFEQMCSSIINKDKPMSAQCSNGVYRITYNGQWAKKLASACYKNASLYIARKHRLAMAMLEDKVVEDIV